MKVRIKEKLTYSLYDDGWVYQTTNFMHHIKYNNISSQNKRMLQRALFHYLYDETSLYILAKYIFIWLCFMFFWLLIYDLHLDFFWYLFVIISFLLIPWGFIKRYRYRKKWKREIYNIKNIFIIRENPESWRYAFTEFRNHNWGKIYIFSS